MIYKTTKSKGKHDNTTSACYAYITAHLRRQWLRYDEDRKSKILKNRFQHLNTKTNRKAYHVKCEVSGKIMLVNDAVIHHIKPVGSIKDGIDTFISNLFCRAENLAILDKDVHKYWHNKCEDKMSWKEFKTNFKLYTI